MNPKDLAEIIKDAVETVGIICGGIWTMYTFSALGTRARAQAEQFKQAVVDITVEANAQILETSSGKRPFIAAVATIANRGTRNVHFNFEHYKAFTIYRVEFNDKGVGEIYEVAKLDCDINYTTIRMGASVALPIFYSPSEPGLYWVECSVKWSQQELAIHLEIAPDKNKGVHWRGLTHILVPPSLFSTSSAEGSS